jgi:glycosyltransferase involved in cell wall biosynthesis
MPDTDLKHQYKISVVVCTRNEENQIEECLAKIVAARPDEVILVDGGSEDRTVEIARPYVDKLILSGKSNLTRDRQLGIDSATHDFIAMIDADHRVSLSTIPSLLNDLIDYNFDIVQGQVIGYPPQGFWSKSEEQAWELFHNQPGAKKMIGTAPCVYRKEVFSLVRFDDVITTGMDDTDFIYRLSKHTKIRFGVGNTKIAQFHYSSFTKYINKFIWYGVGDGQFMRKHPTRTLSMLFHLLIRYPVVYFLIALAKGKWRASAFVLIQGYVRFIGVLRYFLLLLFKVEKPLR